MCYLCATREIKVRPVCPLDSSYTIMDLPLLHRDINPISRCPSSKHTATHWLQGGFVSWNNARNRLKLLITAGGNFTSNPNLAFLATKLVLVGVFWFVFLFLHKEAVPSAMLSTLLLIYWKGVNMERGYKFVLPSHKHRAAAELKTFHSLSDGTPSWGCSEGNAVQDCWEFS